MDAWAARTESDDGRELGEVGVADALRNGEAGDGDAGEEIVLEEGEGVGGEPSQYRDEILKGLHRPTTQRRLRLELLERVVGEEGLLQLRTEYAHEASRRTPVHAPGILLLLHPRHIYICNHFNMGKINSF